MTDNRTTERVDHSPRVRGAIDELMREKDATDNRTTELREKLTERGIEYETNDHMGVCETSWNGFTAMQLTPGAKLMMAFTPEQAIAATLGEKPCDKTEKWLLNTCNQAARDYVTQLEQEVDELKSRLEAATLGSGTCEYVIEDNMNETEGMGDVWFRCTNCDMCFDYADDWLLKMPYCPNCGRKVVN